MKKRTMIFAAAALAAGLTACAPKTEATAPETTIEETQETVPAESEENDETASGETGTEASTEISDELLGKVYAAVKEAYGEKYVPSMMFDETMMEGTFGITKDQYDSYVAEGPMISAHVEMFIGVKAKEGKAADVAKALEDYRKSQLDGALQYPMNMPKIEASEVVTHGDYVFFIMLGSPEMEAEEQGEEAALESAKENNQIAVDTIAGFFES
ncbi:DUF4358 domain-containing protein [Clostridium transplantifaecale]|uniref:DUF4358 domain-containing protein n=1 Tax=Clostridium transplantifaecale TaxID=2479838 RepID=UPI000F633ACB|nr:DUF4358 domain-containing protein [Clostridium transplantifaecale]